MKGMLAGNGTNCIRIVPYSAVQFGSYNLYKPLVSGTRKIRLIGEVQDAFEDSKTNIWLYRYSSPTLARQSHPDSAYAAVPWPALHP